MTFNKLLGTVTVGGGGLVFYNVQNKKFPQFQKPEINDVMSQAPYSVQIFLHLPLNALSRVWGRMSNVTLPSWSRPYLFGFYARSFDCNLEEAEAQDLKYYKSFGEFFRRAIKLDARPISQKSSLVCPCDGTILSAGLVTENKVEHVKMKTYSLNYFLGPVNWNSEEKETDSNHQNVKLESDLANKEATSEETGLVTRYIKSLKVNPDNCLYHCTIYLAPGDYHRFHSPANWLCKFRRYFPGYLLSVSPKMADRIPELMNINERVVYIGSWEHGFFSMAAVGATNVGSIKIYKDPELVTNKRLKLPPMVDHDLSSREDNLRSSISLKRGDAFGEFNLGSTIVLIFEAPESFKFASQPGNKIKFGDTLGN